MRIYVCYRVTICWFTKSSRDMVEEQSLNDRGVKDVDKL